VTCAAKWFLLNLDSVQIFFFLCGGLASSSLTSERLFPVPDFLVSGPSFRLLPSSVLGWSSSDAKGSSSTFLSFIFGLAFFWISSRFLLSVVPSAVSVAAFSFLIVLASAKKASLSSWDVCHDRGVLPYLLRE